MCWTEGERTKIAMFLLDLPWTLPFPNTPLSMEVPEYVRGNICNVWESMQWKFLESLCWAMGKPPATGWGENKTCIHWPLLSRGTKYGDTYCLLWILAPYPFKVIFKLLKNNLSREESIWGCNGIFFSPQAIQFFTKQFLATLAKLGKVLLWEIQGQVKVYFIADCLLCILSTDSFVIFK